MTRAVATIAPESAVATQKARVALIQEHLVELTPRILDTLPNGMSLERFQAVTITAFAKNPDLAECDATSVIMAVLDAAALGLEPTGSLSQAWLIPYKGKDDKRPKAQLMIGVRGLEELARRSGKIASITSRVVYEADDFAVHYGTDERIVHVPAFDTSDPTKITHVYAIAQYTDGRKTFDVMTKEQVDGIRARSRSRNYGPWVSDYAEMARKTVVRRLAKTLPLSIEAREAIERDDEREFSVAPVVEQGAATKRLAAALSGRAPATDAPGQAAEVEVAPESTPSADESPPAAFVVEGAVEVPADAPEACGSISPWEGGALCDLEPGHKGIHRAGPDESWPA
jgi:recombination protein RecT